MTDSRRPESGSTCLGLAPREMGSDPGLGLVRDPVEDARVLVTRLRDGDPTLLPELYERLERRALSLARRVLGDAALAEDAVQQAFAQLWERAEQVSVEGGRLDSLFMTMVHRRAIDLARRDKRETTLPDPELLQHIDERATAMLDRVEDALTSAGLRAQLSAALDGLPPEQRTIIRHVYYGDLSLPQIAAEEDLPLGTVKSRLRLAMAKLGQAMRGKVS